MTTAALFIAGFAILSLAGLADAVIGSRVRRLGRPVPYLVAALGSGCLSAAGFAAVLGHPGTVDLGTFFGFGPTRLTIDPLSGLFLAFTFALGVPVSLAAAGWAVRRSPEVPRLGAAFGLTLAAAAVIETADNAFVFLLAWESLSVAFYLLSGHQRHRPGRGRASMLTYGFSKSSGSLLMIAMLLLAGAAGSFTFGSWTSVAGTAVGDAAYALLLAGFAAKVGLIPFHPWIPAGYGAAPGPARALMAGVAVNVGFYGMWRTLGVLGTPPVWLVIVVLLLGGFTALLGIAHASVHADLARVVAYSSVENAGLIVAGFGVALAGSTVDDTRLVALGLLAATLQAITHALGKSTLFLATAAIERATGTTELGQLRGIGRRMPWAGSAFGAGALTLAGLPMTVGFASEWFLLEAFMQLFRVEPLAIKLPMTIAAALIALTAGFAGVAFVRILGLVILGSPRPRGRPGNRGTGEGGVLGRAGMVLAGLGCLGVAAVSPAEVWFIGAGLSPIVPQSIVGTALKGNWVLQPTYSGFSALSPTWLWIVMPCFLAGAALLTLAASSGRMLRVRRVPRWRSATGGVTGTDRYTTFGYANPTRKVLTNVLATRTQVRNLETTTQDSTKDQTDLPRQPHLGYTSDVVDVLTDFIYRPLLRPLTAVVNIAKRLQSGRLDAYLAYMLIVLAAVLALVAAFHQT
jgi:formate hydrogenlyase subunit 3/multisubunit Na+/H+ antiporter MnhD subunit